MPWLDESLADRDSTKAVDIRDHQDLTVPEWAGPEGGVRGMLLEQRTSNLPTLTARLAFIEALLASYELDPERVYAWVADLLVLGLPPPLQEDGSTDFDACYPEDL